MVSCVIFFSYYSTLCSCMDQFPFLHIFPGGSRMMKSSSWNVQIWLSHPYWMFQERFDDRKGPTFKRCWVMPMIVIFWCAAHCYGENISLACPCKQPVDGSGGFISSSGTKAKTMVKASDPIGANLPWMLLYIIITPKPICTVIGPFGSGMKFVSSNLSNYLTQAQYYHCRIILLDGLACNINV